MAGFQAHLINPRQAQCCGVARQLVEERTGYIGYEIDELIYMRCEKSKDEDRRIENRDMR